MRAHGLNSVQIQWLVEEHLNDQIASFWMIDKHEHTPVNQPGALLQCLNVAEIGVIDEFSQAVQVFQRRGPVQR